MYTPQLLGMLPSEIKMGSKDGEELFPRVRSARLLAHS